MTALLIEHLPVVASAPNGIKKLRELILQLAVMGKLVPQDPNDEPASELLRKIQIAKSQLRSKPSGGRKILANGSRARDSNECLPSGWLWTCLDEVALINPRNVADDDTVVSFVPMSLVTKCFDGRHGQEQRLWRDVKSGFTHFANGDVGIAKITPCFENSKACVFDGLKSAIGAGTTELHIVRPIDGFLDCRYILAFLKSPSFLSRGEMKMTGTAGQKRLPKDFLAFEAFPLAPLAEQRRIVAKVDELMALCDSLDAEQSDTREAHKQLVKALLDTLTQSTDQADFSTSWERIKQNFDTIFTTESSIDALKQTLLQLAVMGRLVRQDPDDVPVSSIIEEIRAERQMLLQKGRVKEQQALPAIQPAEVPCRLPSGWMPVRLGEIGDTNVGLTYSPSNISEVGTPVLRSNNIQNGKLFWGELVRVNVAVNERALVNEGDLLICARNGSPALVGKTALIPRLDEKAAFGAFMAIYRSRLNSYIYYFLCSPMFRTVIADVNTTTINQITQSSLRTAVIPLPPLAEQHRIVAKVDELMEICDRLRSSLDKARAQQELLSILIVERATNSYKLSDPGKEVALIV